MNWEKIKLIIKDRKSVFIVLLVILAIGGALRLYRLGANPLLSDEFIDMNASYGYFQTHTWQAWDFNQGAVNTTDIYPPRDERTWAYRWQVAELFNFLPATEAAARLVSVLWGLITIGCMYFVTRSFTKNRTVSLIAAFLFAVSITGIEFDRKLRMYAMFYPVYLILSWLVFQFFETQYRGKIAWLKKISERLGLNLLIAVPLLLVAALSFHLQLLTANIIPVFFVYVLILAIWAIREKAPSINKYTVWLVLLLFGALAAWLAVPQIVGMFLASLKFFINNSEYFSKAFTDYTQPLLAFLIFGFGLFWLAKKENKPKEALWLAVSFILPLFMAAFLWKRPQGIQYIFFIQSFLIIIMAVGIYGLAKFFEESMAKFSVKAYFLTIFLLILLLPNYGYFFSGEDNTYQRGNSKIGDYRKVFAYVKKHSQPGDLIVTRNFRTYYLASAHLNIYDFGGERATTDLSLPTVQSLVAQYPSGWIVLFDNDDQFLSNQAADYIKNNLLQTDVSAIRGAAKAYQWGL